MVVQSEEGFSVSDLIHYDVHVEAIIAHNAPILASNQKSLEQAGLAKKTIKGHVENIDFFTEYLVYYEPLTRLDEADEGDVSSFLLDWFPRKAMWASVSSTKSYLASFKKFFQWMGETKRIPAEVVDDVLTTMKEEREDFLEAVEDDDDSW
jgi:site-specific recombinase XerD